MSLLDLTQFRPGFPKAPATKKTKRGHEFALQTDLALGRVIAIDQSLSATGLVAMEHGADGYLGVIAAETLKGLAVDDGATGWEKVLQQATNLYEQLIEVLGDYDPPLGWTVVHEAPPMGGGSIRAPESSVLGSAAVRMAAADCGLTCSLIRAQDHKRITVGLPNASKIEHHALLMPWAETIGVKALDRVTNEAKRDALSIALAYLIREHA